MGEKKVKGIPLSQIIKEYKVCGNVWKVGEKFGISGQTIHAVLSREGVAKKMNYFTEAEIETLKNEYLKYKERGELQSLADRLGRTKQFICRKAKELGLTQRVTKYNLSDETHTKLSEAAKKRIAVYGHPRGMLGKTFDEKTLRRLSEASKENWVKYSDKLRNPRRRKERSDKMKDLQAAGKLGVRSRCPMNAVEIGGKEFLVKSTWEYDIALVLERLKREGYIDSWDYEPRSFEFEYNTLGVRTYTPDFSVAHRGKTYYIEVKGWEDEKYKIKRRMMEKYFPEISIFYITGPVYKAIEKKYARIIPEFGQLNS